MGSQMRKQNRLPVMVFVGNSGSNQILDEWINKAGIRKDRCRFMGIDTQAVQKLVAINNDKLASGLAGADIVVCLGQRAARAVWQIEKMVKCRRLLFR